MGIDNLLESGSPETWPESQEQPETTSLRKEVEGLSAEELAQKYPRHESRGGIPVSNVVEQEYATRDSIADAKKEIGPVCLKCGNLVGEADNFCVECGTDVSLTKEEIALKGKKDQKVESRRNFFKKVLKTGAIGATGAGVTFLPIGLRGKEDEAKAVYENLENVHQIETPHAIYNIVYSVHSIQNNPKVVDISDAVILEGLYSSDIYESKYAVLKYINDKTIRDEKNLAQYHQIIEKAIDTQRPIYFVDIDHNKKGLTLPIGIGRIFGLAPLEAGLGTVSVVSGIKDINKPTQRRTFLKGIGKIFGGMWLGSHIPEQIIENVAYNGMKSMPNESTLSRKIDKKVKKINSSIHPETNGYILTMRNALIAQKAETIAKKLGREIGKKPVIAIIIGGAHIGIEDDLLLSEEERILKIKTELGDAYKKQGQIVKFKSKKDKNGEFDFDTETFADPAFSK